MHGERIRWDGRRQENGQEMKFLPLFLHSVWTSAQLPIAGAAFNLGRGSEADLIVGRNPAVSIAQNSNPTSVEIIQALLSARFDA